MLHCVYLRENSFQNIYNTRGTWLAQSVEHLTLGFISGHNLQCHGIKPCNGLHSIKPYNGESEILSLSPYSCSLSLSLN